MGILFSIHEPSEMATVSKFEDLDCWKTARQLVKLVYHLSESGKLAKDFTTKDQIRRAALSSMNNIAEGFGRHSKKEFIRFLDISQSSAIEVKSITYVIEDLGYISSEDLLLLRTKVEDTKNLTRGLIKYLRSQLNP